MNKRDLAQLYQHQRFANEYEFVDGIAMHEANRDRFQVPHRVLKKHLEVGHFVELRIDSPRFSRHQDTPGDCFCESCNGEASKPILRHEHPATLLPLPEQRVPSRGWGEDFWVQVTKRQGPHFLGRVDNPLVESRLHGVHQDDEVCFHENNVLAVHGVHRQDMIGNMDADDLKVLAQWLSTQ